MSNAALEKTIEAAWDARDSIGLTTRGEVRDAAGNRKAARLRAPEAYTLTAMTAVAAIERVLRGEAPVGFQTPATAYGADFIFEVPSVQRTDL